MQHHLQTAVPRCLLKLAENNTLRLNTEKSKEMIISRRCEYDKQPSQQVDIERVNSMKFLGITLNSELKVDEHIESSIKSSLTSLYALRIIKAHGLRKEAIQKATEAIIMSRILYAAPAWWVLTQASDRLKIDNLQRKLQRIEYTSHDHPTAEC